jgi:hypothetical protein
LPSAFVAGFSVGAMVEDRDSRRGTAQWIITLAMFTVWTVIATAHWHLPTR